MRETDSQLMTIDLIFRDGNERLSPSNLELVAPDILLKNLFRKTYNAQFLKISVTHRL